MALEKALQRILAERQQLTDNYRRELAQLDEIVNDLRAHMNHNVSGSPNHGLPLAPAEVRPGQWAGWTIANALRAYLAGKQKPAKVEPEVMEVLLQAGVELGRKDRQARNVRIAIRSNRDKFRYDRRTDVVELLPPEQ